MATVANLQIELQAQVNQAIAGLQRTQAQINSLGGATQKATTQSTGFSKALNTNANQLARVTSVALGARQVIGMGLATGLALAGREFIKAGAQFESAFANVVKTVDGTDAELAKIRNEIRGMAKDIPETAAALANMAGIAGQLGVATQDITAFTRVIATLGATTNMAGEEGAKSISRFMNIMQTAPGNVDRLASTLIHLGNNAATTEAEIMNMAMRIAGAGRVVKLSEGEVMAFAAAMSSLGIRVEAGGSAITRAFLRMEQAVFAGGQKLEDFAKIAGVSADEFARQWSESPARAMETFVRGLGSIIESGGDATAALESVGLTELRLADAMRRMAAGHSVVTEMLDTQNEGWSTANKHLEEAERRYDTVAARWQMLKNEAADTAIEAFDLSRPGLVAGMDAISIALGTLNDQFKAIAESAGIAKRAIDHMLDGVESSPTGQVLGALGIDVGDAESMGSAARAAFESAVAGPNAPLLFIAKVGAKMFGTDTETPEEAASAVDSYFNAVNMAIQNGVGPGGAGAWKIALEIDAREGTTDATDRLIAEGVTGIDEAYLPVVEPTRHSSVAREIISIYEDMHLQLKGIFASDPDIAAGMVGSLMAAVEDGRLTFEQGLEVIAAAPANVILPALRELESELQGELADVLLGEGTEEEIAAKAAVIEGQLLLVRDTMVPVTEEMWKHAAAADETGVAYQGFTRAQADVAQRFSEIAPNVGSANYELSAHAQHLMAVNELIVAMNQTLSGLSTAYQQNLADMQLFSGQASEYSSGLNTIEKAYERVQEKVEAGVELSAEEQLILEHGTEAMERYAGGMEDAEDQAALYAIANGKVMKAQDELNEAIANGETDLQPYLDRLNDAKNFQDEVAGATDRTSSAQQTLTDVINTNLVGAIDNLTRKVEYLAKPWLMEIDAATSAAEEAVNRLKSLVESGAILPISVVTGDAGPGGGRFADGGQVEESGYYTVGERGREIVWLPEGAQVLNNDETKKFEQTVLGGYASGTGKKSGSIHSGDFTGVGMQIGEQILAGVMIAFGSDAFNALMPAAASMADAIIQGAVIPIESEIEGIPDTFAVNTERIPFLAQTIGSETAMALMEEYAKLHGELQLAILSGEDVSEIQAKLDAIEALFTEWGVSVIGTARTVAEEIAAIAEEERFKSIFSLPSAPGNYSLEDIISGDAQAKIKEDFHELWKWQEIAKDLGMDEWALEIGQQMKELGLDEEFVNAVINSETGQKIAAKLEEELQNAAIDDKLGSIFSGTGTAESMMSEIDVLTKKIAYGAATGMSDSVIAGWEEELAELKSEASFYWWSVAEAAAAGLLEPEAIAKFAEAGGAQFQEYLEMLVGPEAAEQMITGIGVIGEEALAALQETFARGDGVGVEFVAEVVEGVLSGYIPMEEAIKLLANIPKDELYPVLEKMGYESWEAFQKAMLSGTDPTDAKKNMQVIIDMLIELGMSAADATAAVEGLGKTTTDFFNGIHYPSGPSGGGGSGGGGGSSRSSFTDIAGIVPGSGGVSSGAIVSPATQQAYKESGSIPVGMIGAVGTDSPWHPGTFGWGITPSGQLTPNDDGIHTLADAIMHYQITGDPSLLGKYAVTSMSGAQGSHGGDIAGYMEKLAEELSDPKAAAESGNKVVKGVAELLKSYPELLYDDRFWDNLIAKEIGYAGTSISGFIDLPEGELNRIRGAIAGMAVAVATNNAAVDPVSGLLVPAKGGRLPGSIDWSDPAQSRAALQQRLTNPSYRTLEDAIAGNAPSAGGLGTRSAEDRLAEAQAQKQRALDQKELRIYAANSDRPPGALTDRERELELAKQGIVSPNWSASTSALTHDEWVQARNMNKPPAAPEPAMQYIWDHSWGEDPYLKPVDPKDRFGGLLGGGATDNGSLVNVLGDFAEAIQSPGGLIDTMKEIGPAIQQPPVVENHTQINLGNEAYNYFSRAAGQLVKSRVRLIRGARSVNR